MKLEDWMVPLWTARPGQQPSGQVASQAQLDEQRRILEQFIVDDGVRARLAQVAEELGLLRLAATFPHDFEGRQVALQRSRKQPTGKVGKMFWYPYHYGFYAHGTRFGDIVNNGGRKLFAHDIHTIWIFDALADILPLREPKRADPIGGMKGHAFTAESVAVEQVRNANVLATTRTGITSCSYCYGKGYTY